MAEDFHSSIADLLRRQPQLPQMANLLDAEQVARALDVSPQQVQLNYLRFKPDTSCLARYSVHQGNQTRIAYGCCFGSADTKLAGRLDKTPRSCVPPTRMNATTLLYEFPADPILRTLSRLNTQTARTSLLNRLGLEANAQFSPEPLAYKPERRCVLLVRGEEQSIVKFYRPEDWPQAAAAAKLVGQQLPQVGQTLAGKSRRKGLLRFHYIEGSVLRALPDATDQIYRSVGQQLAAIHAVPIAPIAASLPHAIAVSDRLPPIERLLCVLLPEQAPRISQIRSQLCAALAAVPAQQTFIHGDFYDKQIVIDGAMIRVIDFDQACIGDPREDLATFIAQLFRQDSINPAAIYPQLLEGYRAHSRCSVSSLNLFVAALLFTLSHHPFRNAEADWQGTTTRLLGQVESLIQHQEAYFS